MSHSSDWLMFMHIQIHVYTKTSNLQAVSHLQCSQSMQELVSSDTPYEIWQTLKWSPPAHTHTHTHLSGLLSLWGLSINAMVFILYSLYILSPYSAPICKPTHHRKHSAFLHCQKKKKNHYDS